MKGKLGSNILSVKFKGLLRMRLTVCSEGGILEDLNIQTP
jgi:hypothetical protein